MWMWMWMLPMAKQRLGMMPMTNSWRKAAAAEA
jgi:hypothetical protein